MKPATEPAKKAPILTTFQSIALIILVSVIMWDLIERLVADLI